MTAEILNKKRERMLDWFNSENRQFPKSITCDECGCNMSCKFAYDPYNTDGDCLGDK